MLRYDAHRSELAVATGRERLIYIVLIILCAAGALLILTGGGENLRDRWLAGAVLAMAIVPFVPTSRWRIASSLVGLALIVGALVS